MLYVIYNHRTTAAIDIRNVVRYEGHVLAERMGKPMTLYVAYTRVSTGKQERSGLGIEGQRQAIQAFLRPDDTLVGTYTETESGRRVARPELDKAIRRCKRTGAVLLIAKLDRLARDVHFISGLMKECDFRAADRPNATPFELHIYASMAEEEARMISARTKVALQAAKLRGVQLGGDRGYRPPAGSEMQTLGAKASAVVRSKKATRTAFDLASVIAEIQASGSTSLNAIAAVLNERQTPTPRGDGQWTATAVRRVLARLEQAGAD